MGSCRSAENKPTTIPLHGNEGPRMDKDGQRWPSNGRTRSPYRPQGAQARPHPPQPEHQVKPCTPCRLAALRHPHLAPHPPTHPRTSPRLPDFFPLGPGLAQRVLLRKNHPNCQRAPVGKNSMVLNLSPRGHGPSAQQGWALGRFFRCFPK